YLREGKEVFSTPGDAELRSAVYCVLGKEFAQALLPVAGCKPPYEVNGLITSPHAARGSRSMQFFFINGRYVKNRTMMAALEQAYRGVSMQGRFPGCVLFLKMPPSLVDVNVHPAKTEVRFARESDVFSAVYGAVKTALTQEEHPYGSLHLPQVERQAAESSAEKAPSKAPTSSQPMVSPRRDTHPGKAELSSYKEMVETLASTDSAAPYETAAPSRVAFREPQEKGEEWKLSIHPADVPSQAPPSDSVPEKKEPTGEQESWQDSEQSLCFVGEVFATYILAQKGQTMYIIDKHAAHERILYEKLAQDKLSAGAQQLLAPVAVSLSAKEKEALLDNLALLRENGIDLEDFGAGGVIVRAVPADVGHSDVEGLVSDVARGLAQGSKTVRDHKTEWVLHSMACRAAIKGGERTTPEELLHLARQIAEGHIPPFCPHGRPVVLEISRKELEKQFGRLG
ncbi:DNA mismatch repair endonuclease MutL, partial [Ruminococcaceae bacterium OttesenSCG-928-I18]|nr:DNA mismatch repair endonuclease MutL [Ruminococcaceae bacterium OttesenSCG-928-I18]